MKCLPEKNKNKNLHKAVESTPNGGQRTAEGQPESADRALRDPTDHSDHYASTI